MGDSPRTVAQFSQTEIATRMWTLRSDTWHIVRFCIHRPGIVIDHCLSVSISIIEDGWIDVAIGDTR